MDVSVAYDLTDRSYDGNNNSRRPDISRRHCTVIMLDRRRQHIPIRHNTQLVIYKRKQNPRDGSTIHRRGNLTVRHHNPSRDLWPDRPSQENRSHSESLDEKDQYRPMAITRRMVIGHRRML